jgi:hypothetical protein
MHSDHSPTEENTMSHKMLLPARPARRRIIQAAAAGSLLPIFGASAQATTTRKDNGDLLLSGRLTDAQGRALAGRAVTLHDARGALSDVRSDGDGRFMLQGRAAGAWHLEVDGRAITARWEGARDHEGVWRACAGVALG